MEKVLSFRVTATLAVVTFTGSIVVKVVPDWSG